MNDHEHIEESLIEYALGQLPPYETEQLLEHADQCQLCTLKIEKIRELLVAADNLRDIPISTQLNDRAKTSLDKKLQLSARTVKLTVAWKYLYHNELVRAVAAIILFASALYAWTGHMKQFIIAQSVSSESIAPPDGTILLRRLQTDKSNSIRPVPSDLNDRP